MENETLEKSDIDGTGWKPLAIRGIRANGFELGDDAGDHNVTIDHQQHCDRLVGAGPCNCTPTRVVVISRGKVPA